MGVRFESTEPKSDETLRDYFRRHGIADHLVEARIVELSKLVPFVPTKPGAYTDGSGDVWVCDDEGGWTDNTGKRMTGDWLLLLGRFAPWTPVGE